MTTSPDRIEAHEWDAALTSLEQLALDEYGASLGDLLTEVSRPQEERLWRIGRLIGITVKEPFAHPEPIGPIYSKTDARRRWDLDQAVLTSGSVEQTWQFKLLRGLVADPDLRAEGWLISSAADPTHEALEALRAMHSERGLWRCIGKAAAKFLCGDKELAQAVDEAAQAAKLPSGTLDPHKLVGGGALYAGAELQHAIPWLDPAGVVVVVGILVMAGSIGLHGFCDWIARYSDLQQQTPSIES